MDEKSDSLSPSEPICALSTEASASDSAGIDNDAAADVNTPATTNVFVASSAGDAELMVTDPLNTIISEDIASTETSSSEVLTASDDIPTNTETHTAVNEEAAAVSEETLLESEISKGADLKDTSEKPLDSPELDKESHSETNVQSETNKSVDSVKNSICELEEELKRLHGGDDLNDDTNSIKKLENQQESSDVKHSGGLENNSSLSEVHTGDRVDKSENKPIMRDSDLEEMLSADYCLKDADLIQKSQNDLLVTDLLICGRCHDTFYFVEEFQKHKSSCDCSSNLLAVCELESKPQVWGFTLWKNKQMKVLKPGESIPSPWVLYQKWCQLPESDKTAWISAGRSLQYCNQIGSAKLAEVKDKANIQKQPIEKDPLALDGFDSNKENSAFENSEKSAQPIVRSVKLNKDITILPTQKSNENSNKALRTVRSTETKEYVVERIMAKRFNPKRKMWEYQIKWENFSSDENTWEPISNLNHCKQMVEQFEEQLKKLKMEKAKATAFAKVKSRPFIKESTGYSSPTSSKNDTTTGRPQRTSKQKALDQVKAWCGSISDDEDGNAGGIKRPYEDDDSDDSFEKKMKYEDYSEDSDEDIKPPTPKIHVKKENVTPKSSQAIQIFKNGIGKGPLPQNILIPDANGVVRINQKQLPSLSTGVYIMSKTAGIIKLDSATSKVATSGGQTIVKVAPKIGQTQIKIVKKDGTTTTTQQLIQVQSKNISTVKQLAKNDTTSKAVPPKTVQKSTPTKIYKPIITKVKRPSEIGRAILESKKLSETTKTVIDVKNPESRMTDTAIKSTAKSSKFKDDIKKPSLIQTLESCADGEESDDGLEELPFPEEIKLPEPESPPGDFILDPVSGKIAGQVYPDIPDPEPLPDPPEEEERPDSLDNIVKLAAADITEEDLKNEPVDSPMDLEEPILEPKEEPEPEEKVRSSPLVIRKTDLNLGSNSPTKTIVKMSYTGSSIHRNPSILNRALTTSQAARKGLISGSPKVTHRVLNPVVARNPTVLSPVLRPTSVATYGRPRASIGTQKRYIGGPSRMIKSSNVNVNTQKPIYSYQKVNIQQPGLPRKIGNTTIRSTPIINSQHKSQPRLVHSTPRKESLLIRSQPDKRVSTPSMIKQKPKTVISMPSLMGDEESMSPPSNTDPIHTKSSTQIVSQVSSEESHLGVSSEPLNVEQPAATESSASSTASKTENIHPASPEGEQLATSEIPPEVSPFTLADGENPIFITGDDGTVYQVAGQNEQGQTILLTQGADGQQQCLLVTNELAEAMEAAAEEPPTTGMSMPEISTDVTEPLSVKTSDDEAADQVVAQVVRAEPPSPGGTHKVVVMLPDGNLMVTQVSPEEYASLELE